MLVALMSFLSGAVTGALMVSLYSARQTTSLAVSSGGSPAFGDLKIAPPPAIDRAEETLSKFEKAADPTAPPVSAPPAPPALEAYVPQKERSRQERRIALSPAARLAELRKYEEEGE